MGRTAERRRAQSFRSRGFDAALPTLASACQGNGGSCVIGSAAPRLPKSGGGVILAAESQA
jgi:hypothetical protein